MIDRFSDGDNSDIYEVVEQLGAQGAPGFERLLETGMHLGGHDDRAWCRVHSAAFRTGLESL